MHGIQIYELCLYSFHVLSSVLCQIEGCIERALLPSLKAPVPDVEALRAFLIIPFIPLFNDPTNYATIHSQYGNALLNMDAKASKVIGKY